MRASTSFSSDRRSGGMIRVMCRPIASLAVKPNIRSAAAFHVMITPSSPLLTMASSEESTIAANRARAMSGGVCSSIDLPTSYSYSVPSSTSRGLRGPEWKKIFPLGR